MCVCVGIFIKYGENILRVTRLIVLLILEACLCIYIYYSKLNFRIK